MSSILSDNACFRISLCSGCTGSQAMDHIWAISDQADAAQTNYALDLIKDVTSEMIIGPNRVQVGLTPRLCQTGAAIRLKDHDTTAGSLAAFERRRISTATRVEQHIQYIYKQGTVYCKVHAHIQYIHI